MKNFTRFFFTQLLCIMLGHPMQAQTLTVSVSSQQNVTCPGGNNGSVILTATNGSNDYQFELNGPVHTYYSMVPSVQANNLAAGVYTVTVTDELSPTDVGYGTFTITEPAVFNVSVNKSDISCNGSGDGSITLNISGATPPYSYIWSNGATDATLYSLAAATYTATVTDANNCKTTANATISEPSALSVTYTVNNVSTTGGTDGSIDISVSGGTPGSGYSFDWDFGVFTEDRTNIPAGTYTVYVSDANNCHVAENIVVTEPGGVIAKITANGLTTFCAGENVTLTASDNGNPAASYYWSNGATTASITVTTGNNYNVIITNAGGSSDNAGITVTVNPVPVATVVANGPLIFCNGNVVLTASDNGNAASSYLWNTGETTDAITAAVSGVYNVIVTNASGCTASTGKAVTANAAPDANIDASGPLTFCNGGSVLLTASDNGNPATSYLWNTGATTDAITAAVSGTYSVIVSNAGGCTASISETVLVDNSAPVAVIAAGGPLSFCQGGSVTLTAGGGNTYLWSTGETTANIIAAATGTYTVTATNTCGTDQVSEPVTVNATPVALITPSGSVSICSPATVDLTASDNGVSATNYAWSTGETTAMITVAASGTYIVTITNASGCTDVSSQVVEVNPGAPSATLSLSGAPTFCAGNSVTVTASVADAYLWSSGETTASISPTGSDTYIVTLTNSCGDNTASVIITVNPAPVAIIDPNGPVSFCSGGSVDLTASDNGNPAATYLWNTGETTAVITAVFTGTYEVTVTNASGCSAIANQPVNVNPGVLATIDINGASVLCPGMGSILLAASDNGNLASAYSWSTGATTATITITSANTYAVTVSNANGCSGVKTTVIQNSNLATTSNATDATCAGNDGTASVNATGGTGSYSYTWSNGKTTATISALTAGTYTVTVDDGNCTATGSVSITMPAAFTITTSVQQHTSCGNPNGQATVNLSGANSPYTYLWSNGETSANLTGVAGGMYEITVTSGLCTKTGSVTINGSAGIQVSATLTHVDCNNVPGTASLLVSGGSGSYSYLWSNGATTPQLNNLSANTYTVTVSDGTCTATQTVSITAPAAYTISLTSQATTCGNINGQASVLISGGTLPYSYLWSTGATTTSISNALPGNYSVTVTASGCNKTGAVDIGFSGPIQASTTSTDAGCANNMGSVTAIGNNGTAPYTYLWNTTATSQTINSLSSGTYTVTVSDALGCTASTSQTIAARPLPQAMITPAGSPAICKGDLLQLTATGGVSYVWNTAAQSDVITVYQSGSYVVTVTNASGCSATAALSVVVNTLPVPTLATSGTPSLCPGGSVILTAGGGTSYLWNTGAVTPSITASNANTYTVTVTNANGCTATKSQVVTVNQLPVATITASAATEICQGTSLTLTASGGDAYLWNTGASVSAISVSQSGTYVVTVSSAAGCMASAAKVVTVTAQPVASITANGPTSFCKGGMVTLTAGAGASYQWSTGATKASIVVNSTNTYTVTISNAAGCTATASKEVHAEQVNASINADGPSSFCSGGSVSLIATGGDSYVWNTGATTDKITVSVSGTYFVTATNSLGCNGTATAKVTVINNPPAQIDVNGTTSICQGESVILSTQGGAKYLWSTGSTAVSISVNSAGTYQVTVTNANGCSAVSNPVTITVNSVPAKPVITVSGNLLTSTTAASYQWLMNGTAIPAAVQQAYTAQTNGIYQVVINDAHGCMNTSDSVTVSVTGIEEAQQNLHGISAYPNPFGNTMAIYYQLQHGDIVNMVLMDINGKLIGTLVNTRMTAGQHSVAIEADQYPLKQGIYLVRLTTGKQTQVIRISHIDNQ